MNPCPAHPSTSTAFSTSTSSWDSPGNCPVRGSRTRSQRLFPRTGKAVTNAGTKLPWICFQVPRKKNQHPRRLCEHDPGAAFLNLLPKNDGVIPGLEGH